MGLRLYYSYRAVGILLGQAFWLGRAGTQACRSCVTLSCAGSGMAWWDRWCITSALSLTPCASFVSISLAHTRTALFLLYHHFTHTHRISSLLACYEREGRRRKEEKEKKEGRRDEAEKEKGKWNHRTRVSCHMPHLPHFQLPRLPRHAE